MIKYKKGDKLVVEIRADYSGVFDDECYTIKGFGNKLAVDVDENCEPLTVYTKPLERKIKNQAAEITRLLAENKRLKAENGNSLWNIEQARAEGQNEAWELARKLSSMEIHDKIQEAFNLEYSFALTVIEQITYPEAAAKVSQWEKAKEKPQKTMIQDFFEKFPNAELNSRGTPYGICPSYLGYKTQKCNFDCVECWNRPLGQIGGEE